MDGRLCGGYGAVIALNWPALFVRKPVVTLAAERLFT